MAQDVAALRVLPTESAALVAIPEAEAVVCEHRAGLDPAARLGVPAHVTVLYPFVPLERSTPYVLAKLAAAIGSVPAFEATSVHRWFEALVVGSRQSADGPLPLARAAAALRAFPGDLPSGGEHPDVVPHLTVGLDHRRSAGSGGTRDEPRLPVSADVRSAVLMQGSLQPDTWRTVADLPLGPGAR